MKIVDVNIDTVSIPLKRPFKTALRTTHTAEDVVVKIVTSDGLTGWGSAAPTLAITGESQVSIMYVIDQVFKPRLVGQSIENLSELFFVLDNTIARNTSARAAIDIALYDVLSQSKKVSLAGMLGAKKWELETDLTVSVGPIEDMVNEALSHVAQGYRSLKVKVGTDAKLDFERISAVRRAVGNSIQIRVDANQGWDVDTAIKTIRLFEDKGLAIEFIEQPVKAYDFEGMVKVKKEIKTILVADESVFSEHDARRLLEMGGADIVNVKLMKSGGIHNAIKICEIVKSFGAQCMMSCMLESKIGISAAAALAAATDCIQYVDLDAASLQATDPFSGGVRFKENKIIIDEKAYGLGIRSCES